MANKSKTKRTSKSKLSARQVADIRKANLAYARELKRIYGEKERQKKHREEDKKRAVREKEKQRRDWAKQQKEREREQAQLDRRLRQWGFLGKAKSKKYVKRKAKSLGQQLRDFIDPKKTFFVPTRDRKTIDRAKSLEFQTTPKGILVPRQGAQSVKLNKDRRTGERSIDTYRIERTDKGVKRRIKRTMPLASIDEIERRKQKWRDKIGRVKPGEKLKFKIVNGHTGHGTKIFSGDNALELLFNWIDEYKKKPPGRIHMYRALVIEKTTRGEWAEERRDRRSTRDKIKAARKAHRTQKKNARKKGNFI